MNALGNLTKVVVCGMAALTLTVASAVTFHESTKMAYWPEDMPTVVILAKAERQAVQVAGLGSAGLLQ
jgi:hypothetical protein